MSLWSSSSLMLLHVIIANPILVLRYVKNAFLIFSLFFAYLIFRSSYGLKLATASTSGQFDHWELHVVIARTPGQFNHWEFYCIVITHTVGHLHHTSTIAPIVGNFQSKFGYYSYKWSK